ncbi:DUF2516 domain-containing protein [Occultella aeris]|uniref:DUF2516 family protein n=1 Tax=Occultella aeris TaxID=2761496 RepID=A0A7M4DFX5_9MICO|nr:DUF2516 family protein [Occultella aeris]VZO35818.1 hypothetical protein HALOF300_01020 [Occultella aeris]
MIAIIQAYLFLGLSVIAFGLALWALVDALLRPSTAFTSADKRTKGFWGGVLALATVLGFLGIPAGGGGSSLFLVLIAAIPAGIYLADVRPAVARYSGRGGSGGSGGGGGGRW